MKIEVVDFFFLKKDKSFKKFCGTMHIYLIEYEMDIRGICVMHTKKKFFFEMPHRMAFDEEEQKVVRYPHLRFTNPAKHKEFMQELIYKGTKYIMENVLIDAANKRWLKPETKISTSIVRDNPKKSFPRDFEKKSYR